MFGEMKKPACLALMLSIQKSWPVRRYFVHFQSLLTASLAADFQSHRISLECLHSALEVKVA